MQSKVAFFVLSRDLGALIHILRCAKDISTAGSEVRIVLEDKAPALLFELGDATRPAAALFEELVRGGVVMVCRTCTSKNEALSIAEEMKIPVVDDLDGHVSMRVFVEKGYTIIMK